MSDARTTCQLHSAADNPTSSFADEDLGPDDSSVPFIPCGLWAACYQSSARQAARSISLSAMSSWSIPIQAAPVVHRPDRERQLLVWRGDARAGRRQASACSV
jgi:hypothetical protein